MTREISGEANKIRQLPSSEKQSGVAGSDELDRLRTLPRVIDHTTLRPHTTAEEMGRFCDEAVSLGVGAISIHQVWVPMAVQRLRGTGIKVGTVVGFPFGATLPSIKRAEAEASIRAGAEELDMVMNIGAMRSGNLEGVQSDIQGVVDIAHGSGCILKVILENAYLSDEQKVKACQIAKRAGADFVKTSTGLGPSGATEADVRLMRKAVGQSMGVKAAGGIRSLGEALKMLEAGASRLGTSASVAILAEAARRLG
ncbi:MAG: deoxyribose-phosphate aldolase [Acidobacteriota bacterium]